MASSSSAAGPPAAPSSATGQAAHTPRQSASARASQGPLAHAGTVPVVAIGNAIVQCAKAVRDAGFLEVDEAEDAGALPKWSEVPKECGFKIAQPGERGQRHRATEEEKVAQCRAYGQFENWARKACGLAAEEVKVHLAKAAGLHRDMCGRGDLPQAFRRQHHSVDTGRVTAREHAVLLCRVAGLRKAASSGEVGCLGGCEEMERLLSLGGHALQEERRAIPAHLRKAGSFALEDAREQNADARVAAVVGLFQTWLFNVGARRLGAEAAWGEFLQPQQPHDAHASPASTFTLDDAVFSATEVLGALAEKKKLSTYHLIQQDKARVIGAWWRLVWQQACAEVRGRYGLERRCLSMSEASPATRQSSSATGQGDEESTGTFEFCMEELYRKLFQADESLERERQLDALFFSLDVYARRKQGRFLRKECGRLKMQDAQTGVGSFDIRTRQVLWKYATMAWRDGWPTARASAEIAESED